MKLTGQVRSEKKRYSAPRLTVYGDVEAITQELGNGTHFDAPFESGDPAPGTFSDL